MTNFLPKPVRDIIEEFSKLPGIGPKSAQRLAMHLLYSPDSRAKSLGEAAIALKKDVHFCKQCFNVSLEELCGVCADETRDSKLICVVEGVLDAYAIERTGDYKGLYHVLHGSLSPVDGVGPEQLKLGELVDRVRDSEGVEIILATNPSLEGEATALYIQKQLSNFTLKITRIARGLPVGGDLEYADEITLSRAMKGRGEY
ncbi:recombination mediator RecR [Patescibacteria group bacterium]|nr:recombination mediator RecR [Patescibacteria group bacterium]